MGRGCRKRGEESQASLGIVLKNTDISVHALSEPEARQHSSRLVELANLIPKVGYSADGLLQDRRSDGREMKNRWHHTYVLTENDEIVGMIIGYERAAEENDQYPTLSLYMSELAVDSEKRKQGYATMLIKRYLTDAARAGIENYTLQTNAAEWNEPVRKFYERFGFRVDGTKTYQNRTDVIMRASKQVIERALNENH